MAGSDRWTDPARQGRELRRLDGAAPRPQEAPVLSVGDAAPDFQRSDHEGRAVHLQELTQQGAVVLYFYPKDFTPVCTREACYFRDAYEDLRGLGATVVGVSIDQDATHQAFARKYELPFSLVADQDGSLAKAYDVKALLRPMTKRVTYVIDQGRIIRGVFHYELRAQKHVDEVTRCLTALGRPRQ
jgi:peroxiredoxin Q/BCP